MSFLLSFISCKPFLYLIGSVAFSAILSLIWKVIKF